MNGARVNGFPITETPPRFDTLGGSLARGWEVFTVRDNGRLCHYRYSITGWNHYTGEDFSWTVPDMNSIQYFESPHCQWRAAA